MEAGAEWTQITGDAKYAYRIRFERDDVLVFRLAPDGKIAMLAVPMQEWTASVAEIARPHTEDAVAEVGQAVFDRADDVHLKGIPDEK